ncbi:MAG: glycoside hydrolase family 57 protein [Candidatus Woesearchaeota archaeon]
MSSICLYVQIHQPFRLRPFTVFDIGKNESYFDLKTNKDILQKVAKHSYIPTLERIEKLIAKTNLAITFSISGLALEQLQEYEPTVIEKLKKLATSSQVSFLSETYHHNLASVYSHEEFIEQIQLHTKALKYYLGIDKPTIFRNTELIYSDEIAQIVESLGYKAILAEGVPEMLDWRSPNHLYTAKDTTLKVFFKNFKLSDDIAFRFSDKKWADWPLTPEKFAKWTQQSQAQLINLFIDFETFGEHQREDSGIFTFLEELPDAINDAGGTFMTLPTACSTFESKGEISVPTFTSWADQKRDLSAWTQNTMQQSAIRRIFDLREQVLKTKDKTLIDDWRKLTTSDHFYYMSTKIASDGAVHSYFSPYDSPYDAFIAFMNVVSDLEKRVLQTQQQEKAQATPSKK